MPNYNNRGKYKSLKIVEYTLKTLKVVKKMKHDINKEIDELFEQLALIGLKEQETINVLANILHCVNVELAKLRGVCDEATDDITV